MLKLRFSKDLRVKEIKKLLQSSVAIKVALQQKLGVRLDISLVAHIFVE